jgi:hypothetical protein
MNYRKVLAGYMAVMGLMFATASYAKTNVAIKTENDSAIMSWFSALFSGGTDVKKVTGTERPPCQAKSGRATGIDRGCEEVEPVEDPVQLCGPSKVNPSLPPCQNIKPCATRACDIDGGGP